MKIRTSEKLVQIYFRVIRLAPPPPSPPNCLLVILRVIFFEVFLTVLNMNNGAFVYNPAGSIKNFGCLRKWCLWAGGFGLVQSLAWIGLTLTGILSYSCNIAIEGTFNYGTLFRVVFMELYFTGTCSDTIPPYNNEMLKKVETILSPQDILIWDSVYLAVAVCWLLASVLIMAYLKKDQPRMVSGVLWTWIVVTFCICAMDLALGIIFGIDYGRFNRKAYDYNLSSVNAGAIEPDAAQLLAAMVASISMLILSFKGFVLWIINCSFMIYLTKRAICMGSDNNGTNNLFMPRKQSDNILTTRPPINAYQEEEQQQEKPSVLTTVFANDGFEPDNRSPAHVINRDVIARAARLSKEVALHERLFRNLGNFQQYPPRSRPESVIPEQTKQHPNTPSVVAAFPAPDYTPPMQRAAHSPNRNQRYQ